MRVKYIGPFRAVEVPTLGIVAEQGKPIEVPDEQANRLLEQETNWAAEKPAESNTTPDAKAVRAWAAEQGLDVPARGKIPDEVLALYNEAQTDGTAAEPQSKEAD